MRLFHETKNEDRGGDVSAREMVITRAVQWELPDALREPHVVEDFFPPEMFERVKKAVADTRMGTDEGGQFHTMLARWESPVQFDPDIEEHCVARAREIFGDDTLLKAYFFAVRYQRKDGCVPHLWEHTDQNGTQTTIDITVENTADWDIVVEGRRFKQEPNNAIVFCGQQHIHSRPPYPTHREDLWTTVLFLHFTQPDHWIQKERDAIHKYGEDGDVRFFNRNRFLAMPDPPLKQKICACHDYSNGLNLYEKIVGDFTDSEPELADMTVVDKEELAPGITRYFFPPESARVLRGLIQNSMLKQWEPARVLVDGSPGENYDARKCYNYFMDAKQLTCHPQDPARRAYESLEVGSNSMIRDFRSRHHIEELVSNHTVLLRYEEGDMFHFHIDDHPQFPRVVSSSFFLNDDYSGGELEFREFGLTIKPISGTAVFFCSGFPYIHMVRPIKNGIRYAVAKWYEYKQ